MSRLTCRSARTWILRARDADLGLEQGFRLEQHLRDCEKCRELDGRSAVLEQALAQQPEPPAEQLDVEAAVLRVRAEIDRRELAPRRATSRRTRLVLALAAVLIAVLGFVLAAQPWRDRDEAPRALVSRAEAGQLQESAALESAALESVAQAPTPEVTPVAVESEPLDVDRLEATRERTRAALVQALPLFDPSAEDALAFVRRLDELAGPIGGEGWPLARLLERLLDDAEPDVAAAAARYLGLRGDRLAVRQLARVLERPSPEDSGRCVLRRQVVLALRDAGEAGLDGLGAALDDPLLVDEALRAIVATGGERAARALEDALVANGARSRAADDAPAGDLYVALAELGRPGFETLVDLGRRGAAPREHVLDALVRVRDARGMLSELLEGAGAPREVDFLLAAAGRMQLEAALPWIAERCHERAHRAAALASLATFDDGQALPVLTLLWDEGHVDDDEILAVVAAAEERRPGQLAAHVARLESAGRVEDLELLVRALLTGDGAWAGEALALLAGSRLLGEDERVWAALAVGEIGATRQLVDLHEVLRGLEPERKLLASACLLSIHTLGGEPAVRDALVGAGPERTARLLELLARRARDRNTAAPLFKLARQLEPWLDSVNPERRRTSS